MLSFVLMIFVLLDTGEALVEKHYLDSPQACEVAKMRAVVGLARTEGVTFSYIYCEEEHTA